MKTNDFAYYVPSFLGTYLPGVRNVSKNTIYSYRDSFRLLLLFCSSELKTPPQKVTLNLLSDKIILQFLKWLEHERNNNPATRNQRLAVIHSFFRYIQFQEPSLLLQSKRVLSIPLKKYPRKQVQHLSSEALKVLFQQPDTSTPRGLRDLTMITLLYDTGARVQEIVDLSVRDVRLDNPSVLTLTGKGDKTRHVPIMHKTKTLLKLYMEESSRLNPKSSDIPLFVNQQGNRITRAGITYILHKYSLLAHKYSEIVPQRVTPHMLRHTKAMHLYQAGVNIIYIRDFLGHSDISSTEIYARADTEMKRKAIEQVFPDVLTETKLPDWNNDNNLLSWLNDL